VSIEQVRHSALTGHSPHFSPLGSTSYVADLVGTISDGSYVELLQFVGAVLCRWRSR
jgi:hypothetical protein